MRTCHEVKSKSLSNDPRFAVRIHLLGGLDAGGGIPVALEFCHQFLGLVDLFRIAAVFDPEILHRQGFAAPLTCTFVDICVDTRMLGARMLHESVEHLQESDGRHTDNVCLRCSE